MSGSSKTPRRVVANISLSLDGRINGPGGDVDMGWIVPHAIADGARDHMVRVTSPATTVLLGRKNYEGFGGFWPQVADDPSADPRDQAFSAWLNETQKVVFSHTLEEPRWQNTTIISESPSAVVRRLRAEEGGDIIVLASASVIRSLLEADAVDRLSVTLCPEIVGGGVRLLDDMPASSWSVTDHSVTESGALCVMYDRRR